MGPITGEHDVDELRRAAQALAIVAAWDASGLYDALVGGAKTLEQLPGDARAIAQTAPVLVHLGILEPAESGWRLTVSGRALAESGALGSRIGVDLGDLSRLAPVLADGRPVRDAEGRSRVSEGGVREHDPAASRKFLTGLWRRSEEAVGAVADVAVECLAPGATILDLGGGHGRYGFELSSRGFDVTLFDRPQSIELARELCGDGVTFRAGDFFTSDLGGPYDAVLLSNIVHGLGPGENATMLRRVHDVLTPDGSVLVKDVFLDGGDDPAPVCFNLTMLMYTRAGRVYELGRFADLLAETGFAPPERHAPQGVSYSILVAPREPGGA